MPSAFEAAGALQGADCLPRLLAEQPIDADILASPAECTLEATYIAALVADLKSRVPGRPADGSRRYAGCGPADGFILQEAQHPDIQSVDAVAQPGHPGQARLWSK